MVRVRHPLLALISAAIALASMLFVATAAVAAPAVEPTRAAAAMSADSPCGSTKATCSADCAVLCHVLAAPTPMLPAPGRGVRVAYSIRSTRLESTKLWPEDPPPRESVAEQDTSINLSNWISS